MKMGDKLSSKEIYDNIEASRYYGEYASATKNIDGTYTIYTQWNSFHASVEDAQDCINSIWKKPGYVIFARVYKLKQVYGQTDGLAWNNELFPEIGLK